MHKSALKFLLLLVAKAALIILAIFSSIRAAVQAFRVTDGYEDSAGFHFGSPDAKE
jgi:hypothetical protein